MPAEPLPDAIAIKQAVMFGDLSALTPAQQLQLYQQTCASLGLNPLTNPLRYLELKGEGDSKRLVLYAGKGCADQLRKNHQVSTEILSRVIEDGLCVVRVRSYDSSGRFVDDEGVVPMAKEMAYVWKTWEPTGKKYKEPGVMVPLQGEDRANAIMKAITKGKNRSTLSFCGLGILDESEVDSIPGAVMHDPPARPQPELPPAEAVAVNLTMPEREAEPISSTTPTPAQPPTPQKAEDDEHAFLLAQIMMALKDAASGETFDDRQVRLRLISQAFGVQGWSRLKDLPTAQLQAGYAALLKTVAPEDETAEDQPHEDDVPLTGGPDTSSVPQEETSVVGEGVDSQEEAGSPLEADSEDIDIILRDDPPEVDLDADGLVTPAGVKLLRRRAEHLGKSDLFTKLLGTAAGWTLGQFWYAWVEMGRQVEKGVGV